jgi:hypothetical protein
MEMVFGRSDCTVDMPGWEFWGWLYVFDTHTFVVRNSCTRDHLQVDEACRTALSCSHRERYAQLLMPRRQRDSLFYNLPVEIRYKIVREATR